MGAQRGIPLIRAGALAPFIRFLETGGAAVPRLLAEADLGYYPYEYPERPISLLSAASFAATAARREGLEDLGCRAVDQRALAELGTFGKTVLQASSVRDALSRASMLMRHFSTHETLTLLVERGTAVVTVHFPRATDPFGLHLAEQYTAMLIRKIVEASGFTGAGFKSVAFSTPPLVSADALRPYFGDRVSAAPRRGLRIELSDEVIDRPYRVARPAADERSLTRGWQPALATGSLRESLAQLIASMLYFDVPVIGTISRLSGMSLRSLQRQLHAEGTSFREVLDGERRALALAEMVRPTVSLASVSHGLGYSHQSSLTRAVRRWTTFSPRGLRGLRTG